MYHNVIIVVRLQLPYKDSDTTLKQFSVQQNYYTDCLPGRLFLGAVLGGVLVQEIGIQLMTFVRTRELTNHLDSCYIHQ